jgi:large subunit ribosomal protein L10e
MRGAFGKPQGTVARVHIGQPIISIRSSDKYKAAVIESLRRAKFKFPGRQKVTSLNVFLLRTIPKFHFVKIYVSKKWGFTKFERPLYETMKENAQLEPDGANVKYRPDHGPLTSWMKWRTIFNNQS